ncbi:MAG: universal stress protein [Flavobacteriaceae bacterium]
MDKRILIPTDFSKNALNAARYALDLYAKLNCEFYFLNVFRLDSYTTDGLFIPEPGSAKYETARLASEEGLLKLLDMLKLHHYNPKHSFHTLSSFNFLSEAMENAIAKYDIDVVVMGTRGATGSKGVIFGSNTVNTMEKITQCPVLAIPEELQFQAPKEIVFPTNYKSDFKRKELRYLIEIAKMHNASIEIIYISKKEELSSAQEAKKQLLAEILAEVTYNFHVLEEKNVSEALTSFVDRRNSDMIAFINRKHFFFGSIFSRPLVKEIGYDATVPILALR